MGAGEFPKCPTAEVHRIIRQARKDNGEGYQNFPNLGVVVQQICAVCGEDLHGQQGKYVDWKPDPTRGRVKVPFPTNYWMNKAKQSKGLSRGTASRLNIRTGTRKSSAAATSQMGPSRSRASRLRRPWRTRSSTRASIG